MSMQPQMITMNLSQEEAALFDFIQQAIHWRGCKTVARVAGGWVRDKLLNLPSNDIDIALDDCTGEDFANMVNAYLAYLGHETRTIAIIKANPDQSKHLQTANTKILGFEIDFVNLRSESYGNDSRIPETSFGTAIDDARRRDFNVNALFYNLTTKQVEDFTGNGLQDLQHGILRTPINPLITFQDDPLRVLRAIRFASRFAYALDDELIAAARNPLIKTALLNKVSRDRVLKECDGMFIPISESVDINEKIFNTCSIIERTSSGKTYRPGVVVAIMENLQIFDAIFLLKYSTPSLSLSIKCDKHLSDNVIETELLNWKCISLSTVTWLNALLSIDLSRFHPKYYKGADGLSASQLTPFEISKEALLMPKGGRGDERFLFYSACVSGLRHLNVTEKKKLVPLYMCLLREELKMDNDTMRGIQILLDNIDRVQMLTRDGMDRQAGGMMIRACKALWRGAIILSCASNLAAEYHDSNIIHDITPILLNERMIGIIRRYVSLEHSCDDERLDFAWNLKPIFDGNDLIKLAGVTKGPQVGKVNEEQIMWQFRNPNGTPDECLHYLRSISTKKS